jgi:predicted secreted protein
MQEMRGQFRGVDTMAVTDKHRFDFESRLVWEKEVTSISNRADVKALLTKWKEEGEILPREIGDAMLTEAEAEDQRMRGSTQDPSKHRIGATMVTTTDAMLLQAQFRNPKQTHVRVVDSNTGEESNVNCIGRWLPTLTWVHPCEDPYGAPFPTPPPLRFRELSEIDSRILWLIIALNGTIPSIWNGSVSAVKDVREWHGWVLTFATETCFPEATISSRRSPFKFRRSHSKVLAVLRSLGADVEDEVFSRARFTGLFERHESVEALQVQDDGPTMRQHLMNASQETNTVVFVRNPAEGEGDDDYRPIGTEAMMALGTVNDDVRWEIVAVAQTEAAEAAHQWKASLYCRHGGKLFPAWWKHSRGRPWFEKVPSLTEDEFAEWDVCVYVRKSQLHLRRMKEAFLVHSLGGQNKAFCHRHEMPLIRTIHNDGGHCSVDPWTNACNRKPVLQCAVAECDNYVCSHHYDEIPENVRRYFYSIDESANLSPSTSDSDDATSSDGSVSTSSSSECSVTSSCESHLDVCGQRTGTSPVSTVRNGGNDSIEHPDFVMGESIDLCRDRGEAAFTTRAGHDTESHTSVGRMDNRELHSLSPHEEGGEGGPRHTHGARLSPDFEDIDENNYDQGEGGSARHPDGTSHCSIQAVVVDSGYDQGGGSSAAEDNFACNSCDGGYPSSTTTGEDEAVKADSERSWDTNETPPSSDFEDVDENSYDQGGGRPVAQEGETASYCSDDVHSSSTATESSWDDGSIDACAPTCGQRTSYGADDVDYDQDRFIVDAGECLAGDHANEFDDDVLEQQPGDIVIPSGVIDRMVTEEIIPTTVCNQGAPSIRNKGSYVPGHVILNNLGSLLIRKNQKLTGTTQQRNFLQRIASTTPGRCVPLLYPEASLFTSQFWTDGGPDSAGSIPGALPCSFLCDERKMSAQGMASIGEHMRSRLSNSSLLTSTDPRYICYAFDSMVNLGLRGEDSRVILSRGFARKQGTDGIKGERDSLRTFDTDTTDSRPTVNRLAAAVAQEQAKYFYTHTCNQKHHFGICRLKEWIDSEEYLRLLCAAHGKQPHDERARIELRKAAIAGAAIVLCTQLNGNSRDLYEVYR